MWPFTAIIAKLDQIIEMGKPSAELSARFLAQYAAQETAQRASEQAQRQEPVLAATDAPTPAADSADAPTG